MDLHISKTIVALYGPTCVGKSSLATDLGARLDLPVRHCSELLKLRAAHRQIALSKLDPGLFAEVDEETRKAVEDARNGLVVEGRFLDAVLAAFPDVILIKLICGDAVRRSRLRARVSSALSIEASDGEDARARRVLYATNVALKPRFQIDTTDRSVAELALQIVGRIRANAS